VFLDDVAYGNGYLIRSNSRKITGRGNHIDRPTDYKHQQGNGCFIDFGKALDGYEEIAQDES
jgi:hypothetical protein